MKLEKIVLLIAVILVLATVAACNKSERQAGTYTLNDGVWSLSGSQQQTIPDVLIAVKQYILMSSYSPELEMDINHGLDKIVNELQKARPAGEDRTYQFINPLNSEDKIFYEFNTERNLVFRSRTRPTENGSVSRIDEFVLRDGGIFVHHGYGYNEDGIRWDAASNTYLFEYPAAFTWMPE